MTGLGEQQRSAGVANGLSFTEALVDHHAVMAGE